MKNLKIGNKIFLSFGIVIAMSIVLGVFSLINVMRLANTADGYAHTTVPAITYLWTARRAIMQYCIDRYFPKDNALQEKKQ